MVKEAVGVLLWDGGCHVEWLWICAPGLPKCAKYSHGIQANLATCRVGQRITVRRLLDRGL